MDNGEWVEGYYYKSQLNKNPVNDTHYIKNYEWDDSVGWYSDKTFQVIPETVCQFIGKIDKNGKKVFEDDTVICSSGCPHTVIRCEGIGGTYFGGMPGWYLSDLNSGYAWTEKEEVTGNIHDVAAPAK